MTQWCRKKTSVDYIRLRSNLSTYRTKKFTEKSFFHKFLGFSQTHFGDLRDIEGYFHFIPGWYKSNKPTNNLGVEETHWKADCIDGSIADGVRQPLSH